MAGCGPHHPPAVRIVTQGRPRPAPARPQARQEWLQHPAAQPGSRGGRQGRCGRPQPAHRRGSPCSNSDRPSWVGPRPHRHRRHDGLHAPLARLPMPRAKPASIESSQPLLGHPIRGSPFDASVTAATRVAHTAADPCAHLASPPKSNRNRPRVRFNTGDAAHRNHRLSVRTAPYKCLGAPRGPVARRNAEARVAASSSCNVRALFLRRASAEGAAAACRR